MMKGTMTAETIMTGGNAAFLEALYEDYLRDPSSVSEEWRSYFHSQQNGVSEQQHSRMQQRFYDLSRSKCLGLGGGSANKTQDGDPLGPLRGAYRLHGHLEAAFNPLALRERPLVPELMPKHWGIDESAHAAEIANLRALYAGSIGYEFSYLSTEERLWFEEQIEGPRPELSQAEKKRLLKSLVAAEGLEKYLHKRYTGQKRFSLEGSESFIALMDRLVQRSAGEGIKEIVIGMAHRGRLNTLVNILGKAPSSLFDEFEGKKSVPDYPGYSGDVKYHMGMMNRLETPSGPLRVALAFNPSHLELVAPVVHGAVRARQDMEAHGPQHLPNRKEILSVTVHGDAAVIGQGVVMETLNLSRLRGYTTGGAVRVVINNQVGFTISDPRDSRSSRYCTDVAKIGNAPVMHVHGDDAEAVAWVADLALAYRNRFGKDVFIDLVSFRRHGHNEADDPTMTQPLMYRQIKAHPGALAVYTQKLEQDGVVAAGEAEALSEAYRQSLEAGDPLMQTATDEPSERELKRRQRWAKHRAASLENKLGSDRDTGVSAERILDLSQKLTAVPEGFTPHRGVAKVMAGRQAMGRGEADIDWGMGEMLAYASLLEEGYSLRLSGEDSGRGTFVHRHAVIHNQSGTDPEAVGHMSLAHIGEGQGKAEVIDSTLSEEAVMAFEYGYAGSLPNTLVLWEAQFGDFANGAQAVIDQFIASGESKWMALNGLVLLLPHGQEGAGPEHSSARLERFLQLCAQNNMRVAVPSSSAQMFHLLRRQMIDDIRKPLVVMTPKSLLRSKLASSPLSAFTSGRFESVIGDESVKNARRVVISSGKLHWELHEAREKAGLQDVALVRLEELYPFPTEQLAQVLREHPGAEVIWAQEEPENQGAWRNIFRGLNEAASAAGLGAVEYTGRPAMASTSPGLAHMHTAEQAALIQHALKLS